MSVVIVCVAVGAAGVLIGWLLGGQSRRGAMERLSAEAAGKDGLLEQLRELLSKANAELAAERLATSQSRESAAALQARLETERLANEEKTKALLAFEENIQKTFQSMAANALDANTRQLLALSSAELEKQQMKAGKELEAREASIATMLNPMRLQLEQLAQHSHGLEVKREGAYKAILNEIENMQRSHSDLRKETTQLVQALRAPKVRGNWGEMQLRRCVEHAGMVQFASFDVEKFVKGEDSSIRPDLIVKLPNDRCIVVDAKTPLDAFLRAGACEDEVLRHVALGEHALAVRKHLDSLSSKAYWNRFKESPDFVVCFLPSEVLFSAALEQDPSLLEYSAGSHVLLATPTTLIALLKAVAYGWQQAQIARDAELIRDVAIKLHAKFAGLHASFLGIGGALRKAGDAYDDVLNKAEGHGGLFSIARKLRELKIGDKDLAEGIPVSMKPRLMQHEDWQTGLALAASEDAEPELDAPN